jgi:hypothetical protein
VTGVQRGEQIDYFGAANLTDDDPVGSHPERLPHQIPQRDRPGAFDIRLPGDQPDDMRVGRSEGIRCFDRLDMRCPALILISYPAANGGGPAPNRDGRQGSSVVASVPSEVP